MKREADTIFDAVLEKDATQWSAFVAEACAGDATLQEEVWALLAAYRKAQANSLLQSPLVSFDSAGLISTQILPGRYPADLTGDTLNHRYEIIALLNDGGMGRVYQGRDLVLNRLVAVKVLRRKSLCNPWVARKFAREGEAQGRVQHPGVASVFDVGALPGGACYLVTEFVAGRTLREKMESHHASQRQMPLAEVAELMEQIGRAVAAINQAGLIHRDLKPENIMLPEHPDNDETSIKIIDFGIVRVLDESSECGHHAGTLSYMSPEQLRGEEVTPATDVYALGVLAYELLTGLRPFRADNILQLCQQMATSNPIKPRALRPDIPPAAERLMLQALAYKPNKWQQSARAFGDELARALTAAPAPSSRQTLGAQTLAYFSPTRRLKFALPALAVVVLALLVTAGVWHGKRKAVPPLALKPERALTCRLIAPDRAAFVTGARFRFQATPQEAGALYLINQGPAKNGVSSWNVLFPTPANNHGQTQLAAQQTVTTQEYEFTDASGAEIIWIVWAEQPLDWLEKIARQAVKTDLELSDPAQQARLREFLAGHQTTAVTEQSVLTLKGPAAVLAYPLELKHIANSK